MADHLARLVLVGGRAAGRRQEVDSQGDETLQRHAPDDVLDVRVEAAVLVDDQHRRQPAHVAGGARHVARQLALGGEGGNGFGGAAGVVWLDGGTCGGVVREQRLKVLGRRCAAGDPIQWVARGGGGGG